MDPLEKISKRLVDSGLLSPEDVTELRKEESPESPLPSVERFSETLIESGILTPYQLSEVQSDQPERLVVGDYELLEKVGQGGMGIVYRARHRRMKRIVAVKKLTAALSSSAAVMQRFEREVEVSARLQHENIVVAFDAREEEGDLYLVTEFVDGTSLQELVDASGPLTFDQAIDCTVQAARGLAHAHDIGVIHRDIKPANLMLTVDGTVKILDLGLARVDTPLNRSGGPGTHQLTGAGSFMGTPDYMSPEQAVDPSRVDHRADIYALGCTLHFLLTGRPMFTGQSPIDILVAHRDTPAPPLHRHCSNVPTTLEATYQRMVAKSIDERFNSMSDVVEALQNSVPALRALPASHPAASQNQTTTTLDHAPFRAVELNGAAALPSGKGKPRSVRTFVLVTIGRIAGFILGTNAAVSLSDVVGTVAMLLCLPFFMWIGWKYGKGYASWAASYFQWTDRTASEVAGPEFSPAGLKRHLMFVVAGMLAGWLSGDAVRGAFIALAAYVLVAKLTPELRSATR
jgi:serine/threonine protein kinase